MNQRLMLERILDILNQKVMMGAGRHHRMPHHRRLMHHGGDDGGEIIGGRRRMHRKVHHRKRHAGVSAGVYAGVSAGRRMHHKRAGVRAGTSPWISHVKKFAKAHHMSYKDALSDPACSDSYHGAGRSHRHHARAMY